MSRPASEPQLSLFDLLPAEPASGDAERRLAEGYYVRNFELLLRTVFDRYHDLLDDGERGFYFAFFELPESARRLWVRLVSRRGPCFRRDRLAYPEISDLDRAARGLRGARFLDDGHDEDPAALLGLLLRPELDRLAAELAPDLAGRSSLRKEELIESLTERARGDVLRAAVAERLTVLRPLQAEHVQAFRLLFFGNLSQDLHEFVLSDLGLWQYEPYELRRELRLFPDRPAFEDTLTLLATRRAISLHVSQGDEAAAIAIGHSVLERVPRLHPATRSLADRILNKIGRLLERRHELEQALAFYEASSSPPGRERRARVLARLGQEQLALELTEAIRAAPEDESEAAFAPRFAHRLRRRRGLPSRPPRRPQRPTVELRLEPREKTPVEALVLERLEADGRSGFFAENWLWKSLFGLAFWDIVFVPVAGAFQHPFQSGPLDLYRPEFRRARADLIDERLYDLAGEETPRQRLKRVYRDKRDRRNRLVSWSPDLEPHLDFALESLHGRHLSAVCDRLSRDLGRYRRGLPDLFVASEEEPGFELLEVKAPGDQLRPEQAAWIDYLNGAGLPTAVAHVTWAGV